MASQPLQIELVMFESAKVVDLCAGCPPAGLDQIRKLVSESP